jgi:hypothetical protein
MTTDNYPCQNHAREQEQLELEFLSPFDLDYQGLITILEENSISNLLDRLCKEHQGLYEELVNDIRKNM